MLKKAVLVFCLFLLVPAVVAQISVERVIDDKVEAGGTIEIKINISLNGEQPSSMIVTEEIPEGWQLKASTPNATSFPGKIKWLLYGNKLKNSITLKYTLQAPEDFDGSQKISGTWRTLKKMVEITGDDTIELKEKQIEPSAPPKVSKEEPQDITLYVIIGVAVIIVIALAAFFIMKKNK